MGNSFKRHFFLVVLVVCLVPSFSLKALGQTDLATKKWVKAGSVAAGGLTAALGLRFAPTPACLWCETNTFDKAISNSLIVDNRQTARVWSDAVTLGLVPLVAFGSLSFVSPDLKSGLLDALTIVASSAATASVTELTKITARRKRPEAVLFSMQESYSENRSFLSGHTSFAFSMLSAATSIAFLRQSPVAPYLAGMSAISGVLVGYTRIAAAKHWASDVVAGMILGAGIGVALPLFVGNRCSKNHVQIALMPAFDGRAFNVALAF